MTSIHLDALPDAASAGRICALAAQVEREAEAWLTRYDDLVEPELLGPLALAFAFASPWCTPAQLALHNHFELWVFALDKAIDSDAKSKDEVDGIVRRCAAVTEGLPHDPADQLATALADILGALRARPLWDSLGPLWISLAQRTFDGMAIEWTVAAAVLAGEKTPTFEEYLANSDSCAFRLIRLTEWISVGDQHIPDHIDHLMTAAWHAEISSRLTNDLRTHERERDNIDLNALMLGIDEEEVRDRIAREELCCREAFGSLSPDVARPALSLQRILAFGNAFYETSDFRPGAAGGALPTGGGS